jgi:histidinol-phosphate aminotransferase
MTDSQASSCLERWLRPEIRALQAYHVADATGMIKLDAMENPYRWPAELLDQWQRYLSKAELNRYPDPDAQILDKALRRAQGIPDAAGLLLGNGSDELIQLIMLSIAGPGRVIMAPEPGFSMYQMIATFVGLDFVGVPLRQPDFALDTQIMLQAIEQHQPAVIFLAYPNNPSGNLFDDEAIRGIIAAAPGLVVIDEAYHAFAEASWMEQVLDYDNLMILRTLSKMGLAGLRLGMLIAARAWTEEFNKIRLPYNINCLTQLSAAFAMEQDAVLREQSERIIRDREALYRQLSQISGLTVYPSRANFILFRVPQGTAADIFEGLQRDGILIKNLHKTGTVLADCLRVTVGTESENEAFLASLKRLVQA